MFIKGCIRALQNITAYGVYLVNEDGRITEWNRGAELLFGFSKNDILGTDVAELFEQPMDDPIPHLKNNWMLRKNGTRFLAKITISPLTDDTWQTLAYLCIVQDITHQAAFARIAAHELRNTMINITALLDVLLLRTKTEEMLLKSKQQMHTLKQEVLRMNNMLNGLTDAYLLYCGYLSIKPSEYNWTHIVKEAFETISNTTLNEPPRLKLSTCSPPDVYVSADRYRITQLLHNLLNNALQYSPSPSPVEIIVDASESHVSAAVKDYGQGIPKEKLTRILESAHLSRQKETFSFERMGIGLAFCLKIAKLHNGTLNIESIEGQGTTVTIRLPRLKLS